MNHKADKKRIIDFMRAYIYVFGYFYLLFITLDAKIYLQELFNEKMDNDGDFAKKIEAEFKEREVNSL